MFAGSLLRQLRQSAAPTVLLRSHRGQRVRFARVTSWSFVITRNTIRAPPPKRHGSYRIPAMGQRIDLGYLATPKSGKGPAIVLIQEWWGLVRHIEDVCDRFADEGFLACAPDLFHGKTTKSPDEAGKMVMELDAERAANEIAAAGAYLLGRPECASKTYGVVGFCMGGGLAKFVASRDAKDRKSVV